MSLSAVSTQGSDMTPIAALETVPGSVHPSSPSCTASIPSMLQSSAVQGDGFLLWIHRVSSLSLLLHPSMEPSPWLMHLQGAILPVL